MVLLIALHELEQARESALVIAGGEPDELEDRRVAVRGGIVETAGEPRQLGHEAHTDGDGRAVAPAVALSPLDGVAERVPIVEDLAQVRFLEILAHDVGLDLDTAADELDHRLALRVA